MEFTFNLIYAVLSFQNNYTRLKYGSYTFLCGFLMETLDTLIPPLHITPTNYISVSLVYHLLNIYVLKINTINYVAY